MSTPFKFHEKIRPRLTGAHDLAYEPPNEKQASHTLIIHGITSENAMPLAQAIQGQLNRTGWDKIDVSASKTTNGVKISLTEQKHMEALLDALSENKAIKKKAEGILALLRPPKKK